MCAVCRTLKPKKELLRVVKNKEGKVFVDESGKQNGRGAYLCKSKACIEKCAKTKLLNKLFETNVEETLYQSLREYEIET